MKKKIKKRISLQALKQVIHETVPYNDIEEAHKLSSNREQEESPQAKGSSFSPKSTSSRIRDPE